MYHFERPRLHELFSQAVRYPVVVVCAGAGYGKTSAVQDFVRKYKAVTLWMQLSERDNVGARFWENYTHAVAQVNKPLAAEYTKLGFPDTSDKRNQYVTLSRDLVLMKRRVLIFDDFHLIEDRQVIRFVEECIIQKMPPGTSAFFVCRSAPGINTAALAVKDLLFGINENDLHFSDDELSGYFRQLNIAVQPDVIRNIMLDTEGWVFAINFIARSYEKAPGYKGYTRNAMKSNIFRLMETEIWDGLSDHLRPFLVRLSLIDHLSVDLIVLLAGHDKDLIAGMEEQSAYIRRDSHTNTYLIHHLFLEFLRQKQDILDEDQKCEAYRIAGKWCDKNDFKIDALSYYEKTGDYESIVPILFAFPVQIPENIAKFALEIFDRAPEQAFDTVDLLPVLHVRSCLCQGLLEKAKDLLEYYEARLLKLEDSESKKRTLSRLYFSWSYLRALLCTTDDRYDFDVYVEKFCTCLGGPPASIGPVNPGTFPVYHPGAWINRAGSSRKGAPEEFIAATARMSALISKNIGGLLSGEIELARGELKYYQGDNRAAEPFVIRALKQAKEHRQFGIIHMALFYILRLSVARGNFPKAQQAVRGIKDQLSETEYPDRFTNYDICLAWYYYILNMPENVPGWFKDDFSPYSHAGFMENFINRMKAYYCYITRDYNPLLSYIGEMKHRESFLFERVEMLVMEACTHYKMKEKSLAFAALEEAYNTASPNNIILPFIEMGKDMRTLAASALKESASGIPKPWLETINRKAAIYAKNRGHVAAEYRRVNNITISAVLSPRETDILADLSRGLSRTEIADNHDISVNTVKMVINSIYSKLGAENLAELIRIAVQKGLI
ncbi:MAG: LuxR C-terminal-related transcriptional regulator [Treponema sp.]|nr:LuxR C-terminal-related transcriptional regulator [Treponema sp.]